MSGCDESQLTILSPVVVTEATLDSSTVPMDDATTWAAGTYNTGDEVIHGIEVWKCAANSVTSEPSPTNTDWVRRGYANRWRMFRDGVDSVTSNDGGITVEITPGQSVNGVALMNCTGLAVAVTMDDLVEGEVYSTSAEITDIGVGDWWSWYFAPYRTLHDFVFDDLPPYPDATITVEISTASPSDTASIGRYVNGLTQPIAITLHGTNVRHRSFSVRERDDFGNLQVVSRRQIPMVNYLAMIDTDAAASVFRQLQAIKDIPTVFIGARTHPVTFVHGYYRDYEITLSTATKSDLTLEVEGF